MPKRVFKPFLLVIDNFYSNPLKVYSWAQKLNYHLISTATGYRSKEVYHEKNIKKRLERLLNIKISDWGTAENSENGIFFLAFSEGKRKETPCIHTDPSLNDITVVIYLTPGLPDDCGTSFWRHKSTQLAVEPTIADARKLKRSLTDIRQTLEMDAENRKKWELLDNISYKFNRMIAFPSGVFHSGNRHFGNEMNNGRIIQTFRLGVNWDTFGL